MRSFGPPDRCGGWRQPGRSSWRASFISQLVPVLILPLFYSVERLDAPHLAQRMARLAEGTGLTVEGVYRLALSEATVKANAMLAGLGRTRRVLLGDTLLEHFSPDEIEVIFAHEIGHHVFRHIHKMIALARSIAFAVSGSATGCSSSGWAGRPGRVDYSRLSIASLPLLLLILTLFGTLVEPVQNSFSRRCERQCDRYALERTGLRGPYVSAFRKLARLNKEDPDPCWLEVLLFRQPSADLSTSGPGRRMNSGQARRTQKASQSDWRRPLGGIAACRANSLLKLSQSFC